MNDGLEKEVRDKIIAVLTALFPKYKIYLFGSRAKDKFYRSSDIDIAIDAGKELPTRDIDEAKSVMEALNIVYKVDVVDLYYIPTEMKESIPKEKVIWKN